jgi:hypothetical protein
VEGLKQCISWVTGVESKNYIYGLSDAIREVRVDFVYGKVTVLPLPRDMYVLFSDHELVVELIADFQDGR